MAKRKLFDPDSPEHWMQHLNEMMVDALSLKDQCKNLLPIELRHPNGLWEYKHSITPEALHRRLMLLFHQFDSMSNKMRRLRDDVYKSCEASQGKL